MLSPLSRAHARRTHSQDHRSRHRSAFS